jgi:hypothetical protein
MGDLLEYKRDDKATNIRSIYPPPINDDADAEQWALRGSVHWHAGGTKITWGEWLGPQQTDSRLHVGEFTDLTPGQPLPIQPTPTPPWAPLVKDLHIRPARIHAKLAGQSSGTAALNFRGRLLKGHFAVSFQDYSSDGEHVLNGSMAVDKTAMSPAP